MPRMSSAVRRMDPIDYQSPDTARGRVPPEHIEVAYGCFPAVLGVIAGAVGCFSVGMARATAPRWAVATWGVVAVGCVVAAWIASISALRSPRGVWVGVVTVVAVSGITVVIGCAVLIR
jgi:hypothetical protein